MSDRISAEIWIGGNIPEAIVPDICAAITDEGVALEWGESSFQPKTVGDLKTSLRENDKHFAAQQDCAGFSQFEWSTTWKEEDGSFFQVGGFGMVGANAAALAGARQVAGVLVAAGTLVPMTRPELSRGDKKTSPFLAKRSLR